MVARDLRRADKKTNCCMGLSWSTVELYSHRQRQGEEWLRMLFLLQPSTNQADGHVTDNLKGF